MNEIRMHLDNFIIIVMDKYVLLFKAITMIRFYYSF